MVVEGVNALPATLQLAERYHVRMPITEAVNAVINGTMTPREAVDGLMSRKKRSEVGWL